MRTVLVAAALLLFSSGSALAAPLVPAATQQQVKAIVEQFGEPELEYVPTAAPKYFELVNFGASREVITYTVSDSRFPEGGNPKERSVFFFVAPWKQGLAKCRQAKNGVAMIANTKVYYEGFAAWRCILAPNGKLVQVKAESSIVRGAALGLMVAAVTRIH
ncbi:MAG: hypothetical protein JO064_06445 [Actinobacteria bacterium]|nr:hypothetical protein [Actinomycetota bacterium]MBV8599545.1 hypothetical protein [Actinomycetota bacterium]